MNRLIKKSVLCLIFLALVSSGCEGNIIARSLVKQRKDVKKKAKLTTLNYLIPSFDHLAQFTLFENPSIPSAEVFQPYVNYYEKIIEYFPQMSSAHSLLGFCYYRQGRTQEAMVSYQKAIVLEPNFFWSYYNLGVILFHNRQYTGAVEVLKRAVQINPKQTLAILVSTKTYKEIISGTQATGPQLGQNLVRGRFQTYKLLALSYYYLKDYQSMLQVSNHGISNNMDQNGMLNYLAGLAAYNLGQYEVAVKHFDESLVKDITNRDAQRYLVLSIKLHGKEKISQGPSEIAAGLFGPSQVYSGDREVFYLNIF